MADRFRAFAEPLLYVIAIAVGLFVPPSTLSDRLLVFAGIVVFVIGVYYWFGFRQFRQVRSKFTESRINHALKSLIFEYLEDELPQMEDYEDFHLRTNVMVPVYEKRWYKYIPFKSVFERFLPWSIRKGKNLQIAYWWGEYPQSERDLTWEPGQGCSGRAFEENSAYVYDADARNKLDETLSEEQLSNTTHVQSILAIPILDDQRNPIGVLNLDSENSISITEFDRNAMRALAYKHAEAIGREFQRDQHV